MATLRHPHQQHWNQWCFESGALLCRCCDTPQFWTRWQRHQHPQVRAPGTLSTPYGPGAGLGVPRNVGVRMGWGGWGDLAPGQTCRPPCVSGEEVDLTVEVGVALEA